MRIRPIRLVRDLSGRSTREMTELLLRQIAAGRQGAQMARDAVLARRPTAATREDIAVVEHAGDRAREELVAMLAVSLVTPFDREDIFRVSRSIDDVLDNLRDFVRELDLLQTQDDLFIPVINAVIDSLELLHQAIEAVTTCPDQLHARTLAAKKSCNDVRRTYDERLAELLQGDVTVGMLRCRELLRRLDVVGLRLGEATDALADAVIKRTM